ncbi:amine oxidase [Circinella umbellata]|nr:amine oxidase [Circinella umbellata]
MRITATVAVAVALFPLASLAETLHTKVAILGGGVSGISAARNLTAGGVNDFMIIEARDELGGRAQNIDFAGTKVELGCNWVQGLGTNPVNVLREKYGLKTTPNNGDDVIFYDENGLVNFTEAYNTFGEAYDRMSELALKRLQNGQVDISSRVGLDLAGWYPMTPLDEAIEYYNFDWEYGENPEVSSLLYGVLNDEYSYGEKIFGEGSDGDVFVLDERGFKHIFLEAANEVLKKNDPRVLLNTKVTKIAHDDQGVTIHTGSDTIIKAEYAIVTFSVGVLQHRDVQFSPRLPDWKMEGIYAFNMATYTKIFLNFPHQFWDDTQYTMYVDPDKRGYFAAWQNLHAPGFLPKNTSNNIFFVTVTQDYAYQVESMSDEEVKQEAMKVLRTMYGDDIPEATDILVPRWHTNPLFRGSYSNWPIGELDQHHTNLKAPVGRLYFAGEALSKEAYGFLQGAWFTGEQTATHVMQCINSKCPKIKYYPMIYNTKTFKERKDFA